MEKFAIVTGVAALMPADNITTDAMSPTSAGKSTATDLGLMLFALYLAGCTIGSWLRHWAVSRPTQAA